MSKVQVGKIKGRFTFRTAAVLFLISAVFEVLNLNVEVPLLGTVRGGVPAITYHLLYGALFSAAGFGLWQAKRFGYTAVMAGAVLYTVDRGLLLFDHTTMEAYLSGQLAAYGDLAQIIDMDSVIALTMLASVLFIAGWWGFALYTHWRRAYFQPQPGVAESETE
ncbi:MAG: hypothetical protein OET44_10255 [Gammaproteobacteria bacterium]|nr:hypothetical protein [Gammaproteobacteria bacterium]